MSELEIRHPVKVPQIGVEPAVRRVAEVADVRVNVRRLGGQRTAQHFLEIRPVDARSKPVDREVLRIGEMVLARVLHRKALGECAAEAGEKPVLVVVDRSFRRMCSADEAGDARDHVFRRQAVQVQLNRMRRPVAAPVVVQVDLQRLVLIVDARREQLLEPRILRVRDVRSDVEDESASDA